VEEFVDLIHQFVTGALSADQFENRFLDLWRGEIDGVLKQSSPQTAIISTLMLEVDAYSNDPDTLGTEFCIDGDQLREAARRALDQLTELHTEQDKTR
jgi:hypothetical protein